MRNPLRTLPRRKPGARRPAVRFEALEDRLAPAATSLYVITQDANPDFNGSVSTLKEYTLSGTLVRSVPVIYGQVDGEGAHDLFVNGGKVHVYNGTTQALLYNYNGTY